MYAAGRFVLNTDHLAVLQKSHAGRSAADVHDNAVFDLIDGVCGGRLVKDACDLEARALRDVLVGADAAFRPGGHGDRAVEQFAVEPCAELLPKLSHDPLCAGEIHDHAVLQDAGRLLFAGDGVVLLVKHDDNNVCRSEINTDLVPSTGRGKGDLLRLANAIHIAVDAVKIHSVFLPERIEAAAD